MSFRYIPASIGEDAPLINSNVTGATYVPASEPSTGQWNLKYVPANMPGCQMMSNLKYVPASVGAIHNAYKSCEYIPCSSSAAPGPSGVTEENVFKLSWWEEQSFFKYPYMLITAFYGMKWKDNFREFFNIPDDFVIIGDSGGFQNMTMNANLDPIEVLRWQEKHCQIGLTFDLPIMNDTIEQIKRKQEGTAKNAAIAFNNRKNKNLKLYAVFQGHTINQQNYMEECYNNNIPLNEFDGIAIGGLVPISGNTEKLITVLTLFCYKVKDYNLPVHFFGLSGNKIMPYIMYLSKTFNLHITFDSSSYGAGAIRREFWKGNGDAKINVMKEHFDTIPCDCPVCNKVKHWKEYQKDGSLAGGLISLHNLYQTIKFVETSQNKEPILNPKYKKFIDVMKEFGPDKAFQILDAIQETSGTQKNLFSY
jgi:tRNA-guanine family transglycosylase